MQHTPPSLSTVRNGLLPAPPPLGSSSRYTHAHTNILVFEAVGAASLEGAASPRTAGRPRLLPSPRQAVRGVARLRWTR